MLILVVTLNKTIAGTAIEISLTRRSSPQSIVDKKLVRAGEPRQLHVSDLRRYATRTE